MQYELSETFHPILPRKCDTFQLGIERVQALANILRSCYIAIAMQPVAIANPANSVQLAASPTTPQVTTGPCNSVGMRPRTDTLTERQAYRHTDMGDHNTFRVIYDSREM